MKKKLDEELQEISGVKTITFCHKNLFICDCKSYDDAIKIAKIAINKMRTIVFPIELEPATFFPL